MVVVVLVVVTFVLAFAILLTIHLIRRVDKQRRLYHAKAAEAKVDHGRIHMQLASVSDVEASTDLSDDTGSKDNLRKKKEVSFSLDGEGSMAGGMGPPALSTFSPVHPDQYDALDRKLKVGVCLEMFSGCNSPNSQC